MLPITSTCCCDTWITSLVDNKGYFYSTLFKGSAGSHCLFRLLTSFWILFLNGVKGKLCAFWGKPVDQNRPTCHYYFRVLRWKEKSPVLHTLHSSRGPLFLFLFPTNWGVMIQKKKKFLKGFHYILSKKNNYKGDYDFLFQLWLNKNLFHWIQSFQFLK